MKHNKNNLFQKLLKTQSQPPLTGNAPSVCYHLAHRMKLQQIRLLPHSQKTNDANHRKIAGKQLNKSKRVHTTTINSKMNAKANKNKADISKFKQAVRNHQNTMPSEKKNATKSKQAKANDNIQRQMMINVDSKTAMEASVSKRTPITHKSTIHFKSK